MLNASDKRSRFWYLSSCIKLIMNMTLTWNTKCLWYDIYIFFKTSHTVLDLLSMISFYNFLDLAFTFNDLSTVSFYQTAALYKGYVEGWVVIGEKHYIDGLLVKHNFVTLIHNCVSCILYEYFMFNWKCVNFYTATV